MNLHKTTAADLYRLRLLAEAYWDELMPTAESVSSPEKRDAYFAARFGALDDSLTATHLGVVGSGSASPTGREVGFVRLCLPETGKATITDFYIRADCRRQGYGRQLVAAALALLDEHGVKEITLTVRRDSPDALSFWEAQGFVIGHHELKQYRDPASGKASRGALSSDFVNEPDPLLPIGTDRLLLRDFEEADWRSVHAYASRDDVCRFMPWGPNSEQDTRDFVNRALAAARQRPRRNFELALVDRSVGDVVGGVGLDVVSPNNRVGFLGYCLHADVWGRGYATEASLALLRLGFQQLDLHRIATTCDVDNVASARVLEKIGMQREGRLRHNILLRGEWRAHFVYGILTDDWTPLSLQPGRG